MKLFFCYTAIIFFLFACTTAKPGNEEAITALLENRNFIFKAQTAYPAKASAITITGSGYEVKISDGNLNL
jgi:hypothetical protein